jgi:hypothetical protein
MKCPVFPTLMSLFFWTSAPALHACWLPAAPCGYQMYHHKRADAKLVMAMTEARWGDSWHGADTALRSRTLCREREHMPSRYRRSSSSREGPSDVATCALQQTTCYPNSNYCSVLISLSDYRMAVFEETSHSKRADNLHHFIAKSYRVDIKSR